MIFFYLSIEFNKFYLEKKKSKSVGEDFAGAPQINSWGGRSADNDPAARTWH